MENIEKLSQTRSTTIVKASFIGILTNILLVIFKAGIGILTNSIAILLDAVNNLSDVLSSTVTIIGAKLSEKEADKEHPLGHGRIEYLSAMIVASIILYAGITALIESIKKIISPATAEYTNISLIIMGVSIIVKILLGTYVKKIGQKVESQSLIASGKDALFDAVISTSVLATALIFMFYKISLEAYVGVLISVVIIRSGIEILKESTDDILGKRVDKALLKKIKKTICEDHNITGAYDLMLHNYGPQKYVGSVHIEIPDTMTADKIDILEREIVDNIFEKYGVFLAGISIYSINTKNPIITEMHLNILKMATSFEGVLQFHAFYVDLNQKTIRFDIVVDFSIPDKDELQMELKNRIKKEYPEYEVYIRIDMDIDI
ncbi:MULTISPECIES: cation diffusion facilitator family transporter [Fusobacterium]|uniref:cation diffusion facilitator family transporter n=1 Tax=Fusobacterium TaxID=848 RepID=UPI0025BFB155|nr:cation diffusion facilitator family transporter [Fusobacterium sp.]MDD7391662.1 cation diffusion facilitator family transporter [Fusobacteriaceae bacterium]MDY5713345.1 cation diffusion facilitator family transporter [Fusobacterium gastrosuis]MCI7224167.1 cation diffusion facilitator family transporter [Fusobacterium sp.]MDD7409630.1 cation diffusion facilitator family transporter [Fusobacteriaceae bacterium]MDY5794752.1 cation diffusion facilitator family transporter [Fusobacterium gastros